METEKQQPQLNELQKFRYAKTDVLAGLVTTGEAIALKPVIENLGLDWSSQLKRIKRDPVLNKLWSYVKTKSSDGKSYDMVCFSPMVFQDWIYGINVSDNLNVALWEEYKKGLVVYLLMMLKMSLDKIEDLQHSDTALARLKILHAKKKEIERQEKEIRHDLKELAKAKSLIDEEIDELMGEPSSQMELEFVTK